MTQAATIERVPYASAGTFGYTNSKALFIAVERYVAAAVADGWSIRPTYGIEPQERAASLARDGYHMQVINRAESNGKKPGNWHSESHISLWGPDGLSIKPPEFYDFDKIKDAATRCQSCGAQNVKTVRYSFAGRCCETCLPDMRKKHEQPGWDN